MTPTRRYWIALATSVVVGALVFTNPDIAKYAVGGLIGATVFAFAIRTKGF